jgi:mechanosensitive ion channel-like protein
VDLQERHQLEAAREHVAKVRARTRPWRYILALVLAIIAAAISVQARRTADLLALPGEPKATTWLSTLGQSGNRILEYGTAVAFFLLGGIATIGLGNKARDVLQPSVGSAHAGIVRFAVVLAGGLATIIITLQLFSIAVTQLVVGGALTGVLVGIAAQQSLANVFAGIVLLMARPFQVGDKVGIRSGALSGLIEGTVSEVSVTYVRLETENGPVHLPNSQVLAAAVGPAGAVPSPAAAPAPVAAPPPLLGPVPAAPATPPTPASPGTAPADPAALPPGVPGTPTGPERPTAPQPPGEQAAQHDADHPAS